MEASYQEIVSVVPEYETVNPSLTKSRVTFWISCWEYPEALAVHVKIPPVATTAAIAATTTACKAASVLYVPAQTSRTDCALLKTKEAMISPYQLNVSVVTEYETVYPRPSQRTI
jgi:hypothetical protein